MLREEPIDIVHCEKKSGYIRWLKWLSDDWILELPTFALTCKSILLISLIMTKIRFYQPFLRNQFRATSIRRSLINPSTEKPLEAAVEEGIPRSGSVIRINPQRLPKWSTRPFDRQGKLCMESGLSSTASSGGSFLTALPTLR